MTTQTEWWPLFYDDPVPGDPDTVEELVRKYTKVAETIDSAIERLRRLTSLEGQTGESVDKFRSTSGEVADSIKRAVARYRATARALEAYAPVLREAQRTANIELVRAQEAQRSMDQAVLSRRDKPSAFHAPRVTECGLDVGPMPRRQLLPGRDPDLYWRDERAFTEESNEYLNSCISASQEEIEAARLKISKAQQRRDEAAETAIRDIRTVIAQDGLNDSWTDDLAGVLETVAEVSGVVAAVAGVVSLALAPWSLTPAAYVTVPISGTFSTIALTASLVSLASNLTLQLVYKRDRIQELKFDAIGMMTLGIGQAGKLLAKPVVAGGKVGQASVAVRKNPEDTKKAAEATRRAMREKLTIKQRVGKGIEQGADDASKAQDLYSYRESVIPEPTRR